MTNLLLVLSKDPYTTETQIWFLISFLNAKEKGNDVSLYLIEDGVTAARNQSFGNRLESAQKKGVKNIADDKSVLQGRLRTKNDRRRGYQRNRIVFLIM